MTDPASRNRTTENGRDMILDEKVGEAFGAVAAGKGDGHEGWARSAMGCSIFNLPPSSSISESRIANGLEEWRGWKAKRKVPQAPRSDTGHRLALLPARS
jgi:hypothetical protein